MIEIKHRATGEILRTVDADDLVGASLADASLVGANLADACLADANLARAYLAGANLTDANLQGTILEPETPLPSISDVKLIAAGLESRGGYVHGWMTAISQHVGSSTYEPGRIYVAPWFDPRYHGYIESAESPWAPPRCLRCGRPPEEHRSWLWRAAVRLLRWRRG